MDSGDPSAVGAPQGASGAACARRARARPAAPLPEAALADLGRADGVALAIHDHGDRLVWCSQAFHEAHRPLQRWLVRGATFADLMRAAAETGWIAEAAGRENEWLAARLRRRQQASGSFDERTVEGWRRVVERRLPDGTILTCLTEISDLKRELEALTESEARLQDFFFMASDWFWEMDESFRYTDAVLLHDNPNPHVGNMIGRTRWEVAGVEDPEAHPEWRRHVDDLKKHRPFSGFRYRMTLNDGETVTIGVSGRPVYDTDGRFRGYRGIARAEPGAERASTRSMKQWGLVLEAFDTLPVALAFFDREERLVLQNTTLRRIAGPYRLGARFEDIMWRQLALTDQPDEIRSATGARLLAQFRLGRGSVEAKLGDRWWRFHMHTTSSGTLTYRTDITAERESELAERQRDSERARVRRLTALGEMAAAIAHQVNDPLNASSSYLAGTLNRIEIGKPVSRDVMEALEKTANEIKRAGATIRDIRLFLHRSRFETQDVQVNAVVARCLEILERDAPATDIAIVPQLQDGLPMVVASAIEIEQVILNIVRNAIESFEPQSRGRIIVTTSADDSEIRVAIEDDGPGVALDDPFRPFQSTKAEGTGLGLSIARTIVEGHGGRIGFRRRAAGGSEFWFSLPFLPGDSR